MRLGGRMAAAIEVLADIEARRRPVADALKDWGLAHRFAGSGDRAAIGNIVYDALRMRLSHAWLMDNDSETALVYAVLLRQWGFTPDTLSAELADDKFAPEAPDLAPLATRDLSQAPPHVQGDIPDWLVGSFETAFGDRWLAEAVAMAGRPTLDLRANTLKASRDKVVKALDRSGAVPTRLARFGVRIPAGKAPRACRMSRRNSPSRRAGSRCRTKARRSSPTWCSLPRASSFSIIVPAAAARRSRSRPP